MGLLTGQTISQADFTGMIWPSIVRTARADSLLCDGSAVSRTGNNANLFTALCPTSTVTMTIASPGVITWTAHPLLNGDVVVFTTSGALPTGITSGTSYYVINSATNTFQVAASRGGTAINTTGSQSGTHTARCFTFGVGDGSTTFNLPDLRGRSIVGTGTGSRTVSIANVAISGNTLTLNSSNELSQGQAVTFNGTVTGLVTSTVYYVIFVTATTIQLASTQALANAGTALSISGTPSACTFTFSLTQRNVGDYMGEEKHGMSQNELASHSHTIGSASQNNSFGGGTNQAYNISGTTGTTGSDSQHNNMPPSVALYWYIHL